MNRRQACVVVALLAIGVFFRFWRLPDMIVFHGDQGIDLLVGLRIAQGEFFPLIGPVLSIHNFLNPPTYYYLLGVLITIFSSEILIVYVFALLNIVSGILYASVLKQKTDMLTAIIFFGLYMVFVASVEQSRTIWNPYAASFFHALAMWLFLYQGHVKTVARYALAVFVATIAITIYPNGLFFVPLYMMFGTRFLCVMYGRSAKILLGNIALFVVVYVAVSAPYILYEARNNFPTARAIVTSHSYQRGPRVVVADTASGYAQRGVRIIRSFYHLFIPEYYQDPWVENHSSLIAVSLAVLLVVAFMPFRRKFLWVKLKNFLVFFGYSYVVLAVVPYLFFSASLSSYRILLFFPLLLLLLSFVLRFSLQSGVTTKIASGVVLLVLVYANGAANIIEMRGYYTSFYQRIGHIRRLHSFIVFDAQKRSIPLSRIGFRTITETPDYGNYEVMPLWYFLKRYSGYFVPMNESGNDTQRSVVIEDQYTHAYVICFLPYAAASSCWERFIHDNPRATALDMIFMEPYKIYFVIKNGDSWLYNK